MSKRFLLAFGLNYPGTDNELNGCVNDSNYWCDLAKAKGFDDVKVLHNEQCTRLAMFDALNEVLAKATADDLVVDAYSGHGTTVPPNLQTLVPHDFDWDNPGTWLTYDDLDHIFMPHEIRGVKIAAIHDSCMSAADPLLHFRGLSHNPGHVIKNRFLDQPLHIKERIISDSFDRNVLTSPRGAVLLAGCGKAQTSADAFIDGEYHGAFTYSLSVALSADPSIDYFGSVLKSRAYLATHNFDQTPSVAGDTLFKLRKFFE